jgi:putative salt-induced outer membrane protein YdiY
MAEEAEETGWTDVAELGLVLTAGNSETSSFSLNNTLARSWEKSAFTLKAGALRVETTTITGASGNTADYDITEREDITAERYFLNGRFDRKISPKFFWYAGAGWDRNIPAGIKSRYTATGGVGNIWVDKETMKFRTDYAATYTDQTDAYENPTSDFDYSFFGLRFSWEYLHKFGENTTYGNDLILDENLDETSDFRADMTNWLAVSMSKRLALKVSLQTMYDGEPSEREFTLPDPDTGEDVPVYVPVDDFDTIFTAALVVNF